MRFSYGDHTVLDGIDLDVPAGTMLAIFGPSGAGKTTIARLVARFWDVDEGAVQVGGVDVRDMTTATLMAHLAPVLQDVYLFDDTIEANVRAGRPGATTEEVHAAARAARVDEVVERLPDGWETHVGEGGAHATLLARSGRHADFWHERARGWRLAAAPELPARASSDHRPA